MSLVGEVDQLVDALTILRERAENDDPNALFSLCNDLSKAGSTKLMHSMSFGCENCSQFNILFMHFSGSNNIDVTFCTILIIVPSPVNVVQVLCKKVAGEFLWSVVEVLLEGLVDYQGHSSSGACVVLNQIVRLRGSALAEQVS